MNRTILILSLLSMLALACSSELNEGAGDDSATDGAEVEAVASALAGIEWDAETSAPRLRDPRAEGALIRLAAGRPEDARVVRVRAILALRHHPHPRVMRRLIEWLEDDTHEEAVVASLDTLARAFGRSHGREVYEAAMALTSHPDPGIRRAAREAAARARVGAFTTEPRERARPTTSD